MTFAGNRLRLVTAFGAAIFALLPAAASQAQVLLQEDARRLRSPRTFAFEMRFGPYRPDVDSEFEGTSGRTPYRNFFGDSRKLMTQVELDYQFFQRFGSAAIGFGAGYFSVSGNAPAKNGTGKTADVSTMKIVPLSLSAVYRFDVMHERRGIPLVPYGKLGLDYSLWQVNDGNDEIARDGLGGEARGGTLGWHAALGLSIVLDFIDPDAARAFDAEMGVNHTHLFFELNHYDISGLGQSKRLHLGDNTWTMGLMFEF